MGYYSIIGKSREEIEQDDIKFRESYEREAPRLFEDYQSMRDDFKARYSLNDFLNFVVTLSPKKILSSHLVPAHIRRSCNLFIEFRCRTIIIIGIEGSIIPAHTMTMTEFCPFR